MLAGYASIESAVIALAGSRGHYETASQPQDTQTVTMESNLLTHFSPHDEISSIVRPSLRRQLGYRFHAHRIARLYPALIDRCQW